MADTLSVQVPGLDFLIHQSPKVHPLLMSSKRVLRCYKAGKATSNISTELLKAGNEPMINGVPCYMHYGNSFSFFLIGRGS